MNEQAFGGKKTKEVIIICEPRGRRRERRQLPKLVKKGKGSSCNPGVGKEESRREGMGEINWWGG